MEYYCEQKDEDLIAPTFNSLALMKDPKDATLLIEADTWEPTPYRNRYLDTVCFVVTSAEAEKMRDTLIAMYPIKGDIRNG